MSPTAEQLAFERGFKAGWQARGSDVDAAAAARRAIDSLRAAPVGAMRGPNSLGGQSALSEIR